MVITSRIKRTYLRFLIIFIFLSLTFFLSYTNVIQLPTGNAIFSTNWRPFISSLSLIFVSPAPTSSPNLTTQLSFADPNDDPVKVIYTWFGNGSSLLLLHLPFEGGTSSTFTRDYSSNPLLPFLINHVDWDSSAGYDGKGAYIFNTRGNYLLYPPHDKLKVLTNDFTLTSWVKLSSGVLSDSGLITVGLAGATRNLGYGLTVLQNPLRIAFEAGNGEQATNRVMSSALELDTWYFIAATRKGDLLSLYINGTLNASLRIPLQSLTNNQLYLGTRNSTAGWTKATIDEVQLWNRSLSLQQIEVLSRGLSDIIVSEEINADQTWRVEATPNDGFTDGMTIASSDITTASTGAVTAPTEVPVLSSLLLNSTNPLTNDVNQNLTAQATFSTSAKIIYNWYVNGSSIFIANLPFDGGSTSRFTRDYANINEVLVVNTTWDSLGGHDGYGAYVFNGVNKSYLDLGNNALLRPDLSLTGFTLSLWFKTKNAGLPTRALISYSRKQSNKYSYMLFTEGTIGVFSGSLLFQDNTNIHFRSSRRIDDGLWHFGALTLDHNVAKLYLDGDLIASHPLLGQNLFYEDGNRFLIGAMESNTGILPSKGFNGSLDDVLIFKRALSAEQINNLYRGKTDILVSQEVRLGETWYVKAASNDGSLGGRTYTSNNVTLGVPDNPALPEDLPLEDSLSQGDEGDLSRGDGTHLDQANAGDSSGSGTGANAGDSSAGAGEGSSSSAGLAQSFGNTEFDSDQAPENILVQTPGTNSNQLPSEYDSVQTSEETSSESNLQTQTTNLNAQVQHLNEGPSLTNKEVMNSPLFLVLIIVSILILLVLCSLLFYLFGLRKNIMNPATVQPQPQVQNSPQNQNPSVQKISPVSPSQPANKVN